MVLDGGGPWAERVDSGPTGRPPAAGNGLKLLTGFPVIIILGWKFMTAILGRNNEA